jgi:hypothetical protein
LEVDWFLLDGCGIACGNQYLGDGIEADEHREQLETQAQVEMAIREALEGVERCCSHHGDCNTDAAAEQTLEHASFRKRGYEGQREDRDSKVFIG